MLNGSVFTDSKFTHSADKQTLKIFLLTANNKQLHFTDSTPLRFSENS